MTQVLSSCILPSHPALQTPESGFWQAGKWMLVTAPQCYFLNDTTITGKRKVWVAERHCILCVEGNFALAFLPWHESLWRCRKENRRKKISAQNNIWERSSPTVNSRFDKKRPNIDIRMIKKPSWIDFLLWPWEERCISFYYFKVQGRRVLRG